ncbi:MAG: chemotaxis protein [Sphingobium sp.]|nr:chemotaxis protein [Sphingobium sp.]
MNAQDTQGKKSIWTWFSWSLDGLGNGLGSVDLIRQRGIMMIAGLGWISLLVIVLAMAIQGSGSTWAVLLAGVAVNIGPSLMASRGRHDAAARYVIATLAAAMPALLVFALQGQLWQMDGHMYFFVGLAALTVLCDWRPIAFASTLIALHHLLLDWVMPGWVFAGQADLGRVVFHAAAVIMQLAILGSITQRLQMLLSTQTSTIRESRRLMAEAEEARRRADRALELARKAEEEAALERERHRLLEESVANDRRTELLALAEDFEQSVSNIAVSIDAAAGQLEASAVYLDDMSTAAGKEASEVAESASDTSGEVRQVAEAVRALSQSIGSIAAGAEQQRELTLFAKASGVQSIGTLDVLIECTQQIGAFLEEIKGIASKTNLLALNASIEAARAGEAGRGFAVVANEVKNLAADASSASDRIADILDRISLSASETSDACEKATGAVDEVAVAASDIAGEVTDQRTIAAMIGQSADRVASNASGVEQRVGRVASTITAAVTMSSQVRESASALSSTTRDLRASTERFVNQLRDEKKRRA